MTFLANSVPGKDKGKITHYASCSNEKRKLKTGYFNSNKVSVQRMNSDTDKGHMGRSQWLALAACVVLFAALRIPWIGHLLTFDEASNLCGVRSFVGGGLDYWTRWFWHHPPMFGALLLLAKPLEAGFAERAEWLMLGVSALNLLMLFVLTRSTLGSGPALWTAFCYAVMPAARCYDLWLKQDSLAVLFGLLALYGFQKKRLYYSGLALGLAFLAKEVAMFYAAGIAAVWFLQAPRNRRLRDLLTVALVSVAASAWWYLFFSVSINSAEGGDTHSAEAVRHRIRALIAQESPDAVLSDDDIVHTLKSTGVDLARRTVAKYREAMNIPSSVQRRREKRALAKAAAI